VPVLADGPVLTTGPFHPHEHQLTAYRVHELMTAEPETARPDWPLAQAVLAMEQARINRLPVVDATGRPAGRHPDPRRRAGSFGKAHPRTLVGRHATDPGSNRTDLDPTPGRNVLSLTSG
jgi:hypothetical protein